jgi:hypothetical protein
MRTPAALAVAVTLLALGASPAQAEDGTVQLVLEVGQKATVGGASGKCDDPGIATITLDAQAVITALRPGRTTCSARVGGFLRVYDVKVVAPTPGGDPTAPARPGDTTGR